MAANKTIAQKKEEYISTAKNFKIDMGDIKTVEDLTWRTHKEADGAINNLEKAIDITIKQIEKNVEAKRTKEALEGNNEAPMTLTIKEDIPQPNTKEIKTMTLKELQAEYDNNLTILNGAGDFSKKKFKTKADAMTSLDEMETFMEDMAGEEEKKEDKPKKEKEEKTKKEKKEKKKAKDGDIKVNRVQWVILGLFGKKSSLTMGKLKEAYMKATGKEKATIVPAQVGMMAKLDFVEKEGEKDEAIVTITDLGRKAADQEEPAVGETKPTKPKFVPPFSQEDIDGAKKKKRKKMEQANADALGVYESEHGPVKRTQSATKAPSTYEGTIPEGRWQESRKNKNKPSACLAVWDLFEQVAYDGENFNMAKPDFVKLAHKEHGINKGSVNSNVNGVLKAHELSNSDWADAEIVERSDSPIKKEKKKGKKKGKK